MKFLYIHSLTLGMCILAALQHRLSSLTTLIRYQFLLMALSVSPIIMYWVCSRVEALYRYWSFGFYRYQLYFLSKSTNTNHRSVPDISAELTYQYTSILEEIHTVLYFVFTWIYSKHISKQNCNFYRTMSTLYENICNFYRCNLVFTRCSA